MAGFHAKSGCPTSEQFVDVSHSRIINLLYCKVARIERKVNTSTFTAFRPELTSV